MKRTGDFEDSKMIHTATLTVGPQQPSAYKVTSRLKRWLRRPIDYKLKSISRKIKEASHFAFSAAPFRQIYFDMAPCDGLLICNGFHETFVVAASDRSIGRRVYTKRDPFDFDKVQTVVGLLGPNHKRMLLVDIGANIGTICIPAVKRGLFQRAIAIEPEPRNHSLLLANVALNGLHNKITAHNVALGQKDDQSLILELCRDNHGDHRIAIDSRVPQFNDSTRDTVEVKSETFNKLLKEVDPKATLIWIDTQGFEGYVLSGASNALNNRTPICIEFWPYGMARCGSYSLLKDALISSGYRSFVNLKQPGAPIPISCRALDSLYTSLGEQGDFTDLLVI
jgi:FkbM family methyltransferase